MKPVLVYGILKHRYANAQTAFVRGYRLVDLGAFPAAIPDDHSTIKGELIYVEQHTIDEFDRIEGHPHFYLRTDVEVEVEEGNQIEVVQAEMYVINKDAWYHQSEHTDNLHIVHTTSPRNIIYEYLLA